MAWTGWDGSIYYSTKPHGGSWSGPTQISNVTSSHDPALVASDTDVYLFYRDKATGYLKFIKWSGSSWSGLYTVPNTQTLTRDPSADFDALNGRFLISYIEGNENAPGQVKVIEMTVSQGNESFSSSSTFSECAYNTGQHNWEGQVSISAIESDMVYLVGVHSQWGSYGYELEQATGKRVGGSWVFDHHGNLERIADAIDTDGTNAVAWSWDIMGSSAVVFSK